MESSRRALLGMAAATAAVIVAKPDAAEAADGDNMKLGQDNQTTNLTTITSERNGGLAVYSTTDDGAVVGHNTASDGYGLRGTGAYIGVDAIGGQIGLLADSEGIAVQAETFAGTAVRAWGSGPASTALSVEGTVRFSTSGRVRVAAKQNKVTVPVPSRPTSMVLATIQGYQAGLYVAGVVITSTNFTIRLSQQAAAPVDVAWFLIG